MKYNYKYINTPAGVMIACSSEKGICLLEFADDKKDREYLSSILKIDDRQLEENENPFLEKLEQELNEYFSGNRKNFTLPIDIRGTDFQKQVWASLLHIPYGETRSYAQQAQMLGKPSSTRAVANANGKNRVYILIPCHRVIGSDGKLTGYAGGIERKKYLLDIEQ